MDVGQPGELGEISAVEDQVEVGGGVVDPGIGDDEYVGREA